MSSNNRFDEDLATIEQQEALLQFERFDESVAWDLGMALRQYFEQHGLAVLIEIRACRETVFLCAMKGTTPANADWARRKRNTVELSGRSSYAVGLMNARQAVTQQSLSGLPLRDYSDHGGAFPIRVRGAGAIGVVTVSGLPQREDHTRVVEAMASHLQVSLGSWVLTP